MSSWIFQGNPDRFNVDQYLRERSHILWTVSRKSHQKKVKVGDLVYLWRARGRRVDRVAGVVAVGRIVDACKPLSEITDRDRDGTEHYADGGQVFGEIKAGILIDEFRLSPQEGMVTLTDIRQDERLSKMRIVTVRTGSNFLLSQEEAKRLLDLWMRGGVETEEEIYQGNGYEAREGRVREAIHRYRERDRELISTAKREFLSRHGRLYCQLCEFSFEEVYGPLGRGFIEAHHKKPVSELAEGEKTRVSDLMMVCSNCHRMIHCGDHKENLRVIRARLTSNR